MKTIYTLLLLLLPVTSFSQKFPDKPIEKIIPPCLCCKLKSITGIIDFQSGGADPVIMFACSDIVGVTIKRVGTGVFELTSSYTFDPDKTFMYFQSESSVFREIQAQTQPNGSIFIQTFQNGVLTDIVTQNVSFEIKLF